MLLVSNAQRHLRLQLSTTPRYGLQQLQEITKELTQSMLSHSNRASNAPRPITLGRRNRLTASTFSGTLVRNREEHPLASLSPLSPLPIARGHRGNDPLSNYTGGQIFQLCPNGHSLSTHKTQTHTQTRDCRQDPRAKGYGRHPIKPGALARVSHPYRTHTLRQQHNRASTLPASKRRAHPSASPHSIDLKPSLILTTLQRNASSSIHTREHTHASSPPSQHPTTTA